MIIYLFIEIIINLLFSKYEKDILNIGLLKKFKVFYKQKIEYFSENEIYTVSLFYVILNI